MLIGSAAHFKVCSCGQHGHICLANGTVSADVCDKESALAAMEAAIKEGWIMKEEALILRDQIQGSSLPKTREEASPLLDLAMELTNQLRWGHEDRQLEEATRMATLMPQTATVH